MKRGSICLESHEQQPGQPSNTNSQRSRGGVTRHPRFPIAPGIACMGASSRSGQIASTGWQLRAKNAMMRTAQPTWLQRLQNRWRLLCD